jgi:hypothetical protein
MCVGRVQFADAEWTAHYVTGSAGRVLTHGLPNEFSCRVTLKARELQVVSGGGGGEVRPWTGPKWVHLEHASQTTIWVNSDKDDVEGVELDYWSTTDAPTQFRAYIQDLEAGPTKSPAEELCSSMPEHSPMP